MSSQSNTHNAAGASVDGKENAYVKSSVGYAQAVTVGSTPIPHGPCDFVLFSADTTATMVFAEDTTGVPVPLKGGQFHACSVTSITAVTGGVTAVAGWIRRPDAA